MPRLHDLQESKTRRSLYPKMIQISDLFERVQVDLIDMSPDSNPGMRLNISGFRYILTITEGFSRYCFLYSLRQKTGREVSSSLLHFLLTNGSPKIFHSDNGKEFVNDMVEKILGHCGTIIVHGRPYHPESQV